MNDAQKRIGFAAVMLGSLAWNMYANPKPVAYTPHDLVVAVLLASLVAWLFSKRRRGPQGPSWRQMPRTSRFGVILISVSFPCLLLNARAYWVGMFIGWALFLAGVWMLAKLEPDDSAA